MYGRCCRGRKMAEETETLPGFEEKGSIGKRSRGVEAGGGFRPACE